MRKLVLTGRNDLILVIKMKAINGLEPRAEFCIQYELVAETCLVFQADLIESCRPLLEQFENILFLHSV